MGAIRKPASHLRIADRVVNSPVPANPQMGIILVDGGLRPIGVDDGAALILRDFADSGAPSMRDLPEAILDAVRRCRAGNHPGGKSIVRLGSSDYECRSYRVDPCDGVVTQTVYAIHLHRQLSEWDLVSHISSEYHLTDRERETLRGIASGLSSKELAAQMSISPNTVKSFLRLIMGKMSVSSRAAILAKMREYDRSR